MTEQEAADARVVDSARSVISVINGSLTGHARHASDLAARASKSAAIDPVREFVIFSNRALRDWAALFRSTWAVLEALASQPGPLPPTADVPPASNLLKASIGPVTGGPCQPADLRRRGEPSPTIAAACITVTRNPNDAALLDLEIQAGGAERGLYEGTVTIGTAAAGQMVTYNLYVDY
jgi:hypothetical protein